MTGRGRGQTQQDLVVGVSVFLLAVFFVFSFVPTTIAPTGANTEAESYVADRLGESVLENVTSTDEANRLNVTRTEQFFDSHRTRGSIGANYSVDSVRQVNVTLETLSGVTIALGGDLARAGDDYPGGVGVASTRVVRLGGDRYRLVIRVW